MCSVVREQNAKEEKEAAAATGQELTVMIRRQAESFRFSANLSAEDSSLR